VRTKSLFLLYLNRTLATTLDPAANSCVSTIYTFTYGAYYLVNPAYPPLNFRGKIDYFELYVRVEKKILR